MQGPAGRERLRWEDGLEDARPFPGEAFPPVKQNQRREVLMGVKSILKGHELFLNLNVEEVDAISDFSERRGYDKGDTIFPLGQKAEKVYILLEGAVYLRLPASPEEFRIVIAKLEKDDLFGLSPLLGSERYTVETQCAEDTEVLAIDAVKFRKLLENSTTSGLYIMSEVAKVYFERYVELLKRLQNIVLQIPLIP
jgi:signal-transduction protein with cAMP-binding, CBS, and nucleotidyltransferase domain